MIFANAQLKFETGKSNDNLSKLLYGSECGTQMKRMLAATEMWFYRRVHIIYRWKAEKSSGNRNQNEAYNKYKSVTSRRSNS